VLKKTANVIISAYQNGKTFFFEYGAT